MRTITLGRTGIAVKQNAFGALPIQRVSFDEAALLLNSALDGGMNFIDTARAYSDSEEKIGRALSSRRSEYILATKTQSETQEGFWNDLHASLKALRTDVIDLYQLHCVKTCYGPDDETGLYDCLLKAREQGKIKHIGITTHQLATAQEIIESDLYETLQYPFNYLASEHDIALVKASKDHNMGFIAMKALSGGLITNAFAAMAFLSQYDNVVPIWGIQRESELQEFLHMMTESPAMTAEYEAIIAKDRQELAGDFCRGCGYCMPCPMDIPINDAARMSQLIRRSPSARWMTPEWQQKMERITSCLHCGQCSAKCPYGLNTPALLLKNLTDYRKIISGEIKL